MRSLYISKTLLYASPIILLIGVGFGVTFSNIQQENESSEFVQETSQIPDRIILPAQTNPLPLIGFEIDNPLEYKVNLLEYSVNEFQEKQTFRIVLENNSNILIQRRVDPVGESESGADNSIREVIVNETEDIPEELKIRVDNTALYAYSVDPQTYYLVEEENRLEGLNQGDSEHIFELDLFSDENKKKITKTTMVIELSGDTQEEIDTDLQGLLEVTSTLKQTQSLFSSFPEKTLNKGGGVPSPFGGMMNNTAVLTQGYSEEHQAFDLYPSAEYFNTDVLYQQTQEPMIYSMCDGVGYSRVDPTTNAKIIRIDCFGKKDENLCPSDTPFELPQGAEDICNEFRETLYSIEYWHNSFNAIGNEHPVSLGQPIGIMGDTGISDGEHIHLKFINKKGEPFEALTFADDSSVEFTPSIPRVVALE